MNIPMKKMMSQVTPKHMLENKILLKLEKIFNSIEINSNSTYPLSEPSVHGGVLLSLSGQHKASALSVRT